MYVYSLSDAYQLLNCLSITGVFEKPTELASYPDCCGCDVVDNSCYNEDNDEYPLQPHYIDLIKTEIVSDYMKLKQVPEDYENNATDQ